MEIKNLKKVANRIKKAIKNKEKIILYGDADLDGTASVVILKEAIENLSGKVAQIYFVDRENEGYGVNGKALEFLKPSAPALLITLDLGITNFEEMKKAKKMGFEVIIIDHHQVLNTLPEASIIVDPNQRDDKYPFKKLCTTGIVYRLIKILFGKNFSQSLNNNFLELVALATRADMMPQEEENKIYVEKGLQELERTQRPGLRAFWEIDVLPNLGKKEVIQKIISALNVSGLKDHLTKTYLLLTSKSEKETRTLAKKLLKESEQRHLRIQQITQKIENRILISSSPIIFEGETNCFNTIIGAIASQLCNKYKKPTFIFNKMKEKSIGAVRMPHGLDGVKAMSACSKFLLTFGGHAPAAGFSIKNENLERFKKCLIQYFTKI